MRLRDLVEGLGTDGLAAALKHFMLSAKEDWDMDNLWDDSAAHYVICSLNFKEVDSYLEPIESGEDIIRIEASIINAELREVRSPMSTRCSD